MVFFAITSELRGTPESILEPFVTAWTVQRTGENNNSMSSQVVGDRFDQLFTGCITAISKSWKVRYHPAALMIGTLPRQGLITDYNPLSGS